MSLTSRTRQMLIGAAHTLHPIVIIGNQGVTQGVLLEIDRALYDHELIKIRLPKSNKEDKALILQALTQPLKAECLKTIGHIAILYKKSDKQTKSIPR